MITRMPRHRQVLGGVALVALAAVAGSEALLMHDVDEQSWPSGVQVAWSVSTIAPAAGAVLGLVLGAPARLRLRALRRRSPWVGRSLSHALLGMAVALTVVALVPAMVGDRRYCPEGCAGFLELAYALSLGSCAAVALVVGLVLYALSSGPTIQRQIIERPAR